MTTILNKKMFLEQMAEILKDDDFLVITKTKILVRALEKKGYKTAEFAFAGNVFKNPKNCSDFLTNTSFAFVCVKKSELSEEINQQIKLAT